MVFVVSKASIFTVVSSSPFLTNLLQLRRNLKCIQYPFVFFFVILLLLPSFSGVSILVCYLFWSQDFLWFLSMFVCLLRQGRIVPRFLRILDFFSQSWSHPELYYLRYPMCLVDFAHFITALVSRLRMFAALEGIQPRLLCSRLTNVFQCAFFRFLLGCGKDSISAMPVPSSINTGQCGLCGKSYNIYPEVFIGRFSWLVVPKHWSRLLSRYHAADLKKPLNFFIKHKENVFPSTHLLSASPFLSLALYFHCVWWLL